MASSSTDQAMGDDPPASSQQGQQKKLAPSSLAIHADDYLNDNHDVAPPMHVATTFRYSENPEDLIAAAKRTDYTPDAGHIYSRVSAPSTTRLEAILSSLLKGESITYSSGLSAFHAMLVFLNPKRISIGDGYHGCHGVIGLHKKLTGLIELPLDCSADSLQPGDIVHVETPLNPTGELRDLQAFAEKAHSRGAFLTVDATFGPPPLQDPFTFGADIVMHSGTKYIGGHSDMLSGILAVNPKHNSEEWAKKLKDERVYLGSVPGSLEAWLGVRSVRTLEIRVLKQAENTTQLVKWLVGLSKASGAEQSEDSKIVQKVVSEVLHGSVQAEELRSDWPTKQMPNGFGPVFSIVLRTEEAARRFPSKLGLFHHATSLGGVESLIEWRAMSDASVDTRLLRVSVGIEAWEDLRDDILQGFKQLIEELNL